MSARLMNLLSYRVSWSQLAWFGHRISGLGVLLYLFMHIVETSTVLLGPDVYNAAVGIFKNLPARIGEVVLMAAVVYHALNGIRVIAMDFWPGLTIYYRPLTYGVIAATIVAMIPLGLLMLRPFMPWGG
ncbi:MAG TPA: succinate dehydrogenase, cytochrome b556 subunit [Candidatus Limnocylindria bacterium]|nr:succinate dehydrogenase, cytochrome b556 subunit [Candidatus Limnocylindria bacterium]